MTFQATSSPLPYSRVQTTSLEGENLTPSRVSSVISPSLLATVDLVPQATDVYTGNGHSYYFGAKESVTSLGDHATESAGHMTSLVIGPRPTSVPEESELPKLHDTIPPPTVKGLKVQVQFHQNKLNMYYISSNKHCI